MPHADKSGEHLRARERAREIHKRRSNAGGNRPRRQISTTHSNATSRTFQSTPPELSRTTMTRVPWAGASANRLAAALR